MQDCVGKFVEFNIDFAGAESLAVGAAVSKDLSFNGELWKMHCYPRSAPGDDGAGEYLSVHLVNKSNARSGRVLFEAMVLGRGAGATAAAAGHLPSVHRAFQRTCDYPKDSARLPLTRIFRTSELAEHCAVCGYVTVVCSVVVLRHSPIPVPPSGLVRDLRHLEVQNRYGTPDVTFAMVDGKSVDVNSSVLSARSPVLKEVLEAAAQAAPNKFTAVEEKSDDSPMEEESGEPPAVTIGGEEDAAEMPDYVKFPPPKITVDAPRGLQAWTFYVLLVYIYCDRLPRDNECCGAPVTTDLLRELLAAADRYRMHRLKLMCARKLWEGVSVETVSRTLWYAHQHNCRELKTACMNFITVADNSYHVMLTEEFHWLRQESPTIINELKQRATTKYL